MLLIQCSIKNSLVNVWLGKIPQPMKITVVTTILTRILLNDQPNQIPATWTSQASDFESE